MAVNTRLAYATACRKFQEFRVEYKLPTSWPIAASHLVLFISYCFETGLAASTIRLYISGISFVHKIHNWPDPSEYFMIKKMLEGCRRLRQRKDVRVPITLSILTRICQQLTFVTYSRYETLLFQAVYSLAYFGLFRVSELVATSIYQTSHALCANDVQFEPSFEAIIICIRSSKTNQVGGPVRIRIPDSADNNLSCVQLMREYVQVRPKHGGFFFCHANGNPLTRSQFSGVLCKALKQCGFLSGSYKSHSFRIGRASELAVQGVSGENIKKMGRWSSSAYKTYLRL